MGSVFVNPNPLPIYISCNVYQSLLILPTGLELFFILFSNLIKIVLDLTLVVLHLIVQIAASFLIHKRFQLGDVPLVEVNFALHILQIGPISFELQLAASSNHIGLFGFFLEAFSHLSGLPLVNLLHLPVLISYDCNVFGLDATLLPKFILISHCVVYVTSLCLCFSFCCSHCSLSNLFPHGSIFLSNLFEFFLLSAFFQLMCRKTVHMILDYLLIERLQLLNLIGDLLQFLSIFEVLFPLHLFE